MSENPDCRSDTTELADLYIPRGMQITPFRMTSAEALLYRFYCSRITTAATWLAVVQAQNITYAWYKNPLFLSMIKMKGVYKLNHLNDNFRFCLLTMASHHLALAHERTPIHFLDQTLRSLQQTISRKRVDANLLKCVTSLGIFAMVSDNYSTAHSHFKGLTAIIQFINENDQHIDLLMTYVIQTAWNANAILALCGYGLAIPSEIVNKDTSWVRMYRLDDQVVERWVRFELEITEYLYEIATYKEWVEQLRRRDEETSGSVCEHDIVKRGEELKSAIYSWGSGLEPPTEISSLPEKNTEHRLNDKTRFLDYPKLQFCSPFHGEIYLLWYTSLLILSYIRRPHPAVSDHERLALAIRFCQCLAALGDEYGAVTIKSLGFGLFYATLTFKYEHPHSILSLGNTADI